MPRDFLLIAEAKIDASFGEATADKPFSIAAYNGGIMTVEGFGSVLIDLQGVRLGDNVTLLEGHENTNLAVIGVGTPSVKGGSIVIDGAISPDLPAAARAVQIASKGVRLQASIGAEVIKAKRIERGKSVNVNGRTFRAEGRGFLLVQQSQLKHVAILPNGADGSTAVNIAAQAASLEESDMNFQKWLEAKKIDNFDELAAGVQAMIKAQFDAEQKAADDQDKKDLAAKAAKSGANDHGDDDDPVATLRASMAKESKRIALVSVAAKDHPEILAKAIDDGWDEETTKTHVELATLRAGRKGPAIHVHGSNGKPLDGAVIEAAVCMSLSMPNVDKHFKAETLEAAQSRFSRGVGLQELLLMAAQANGYAGPLNVKANLREVLRAACSPDINAAFSTLSLPGIFQNVANKELLAGFAEQDQTWREIATVRSVTDFKTVTSYRMLDDLEYEEVGPDGEIKHGTLTEESFTRRAKTYAKMFSLTRTDIINDDLGALDDLRSRLGAGAARKFNNVFWAAFMDNSSFFTSGRGNYIEGAGTALDINGDGLAEAILSFDEMQSPDGKRIGGAAAMLLVPPQLQFVAKRLYVSTTVNTGGSSSNDTVGDANIYSGLYRPVVCRWLSDSNFTGYSTKAFYLLREKSSLAAMVVSLLNGVANPTVEMADANFNTLGIEFRGYHDFGCDKAEWLAGVKSKGEA